MGNLSLFLILFLAIPTGIFTKRLQLVSLLYGSDTLEIIRVEQLGTNDGKDQVCFTCRHFCDAIGPVAFQTGTWLAIWLIYFLPNQVPDSVFC